MTEAPSLHPEVLLASAAALGLDVARVQGALTARTYRDAVRAEVALGLERGVVRTPTFHVDGVPVPPAADLSALRARLEEALAAAR
jgi:predicted DsbA family dithiol-disulfide isomerase